MTTADIEDVLSSIRKLVSEDGRPAPARAALRLGADPGKLILTPALRVMQADPAPAVVASAAPVAEDDLPEPLDDVQAVRFTSVRLDGVVASIGAAVDDVARAAPWEPETGDAQVTELPWVRPARLHPVLANPVPEAPAEPAPEAQAEAAADFAPEAQADIAPEAKADIAPEALADIAPEPAPQPQPVTDAAPEPAQPVTPHLRPVTDPAPEPAAHLRPVPDPAPEAEEAPQVWSVVDDDSPLELDEEALREIIREVIRAELQGQLGERITRNIRKLVRSEVQRALLVRDID